MIELMDVKTYAIKIKLGEADWIYVTKGTTRCMDLTPETFENMKDAERFAEPWKQAGINVEIVEYS